MKLISSLKKSRENAKYWKRFVVLINHPIFWILTIAGNAMIFIGAILLFYLEAGGRELPLKFVDCLVWSTSIVTTIGYVTFLPNSFFGKITVIGLMLLGTFFLWSYMALLVSAFISPALSSLEKEVLDVEKELSALKSEDNHRQINKLGNHEA